MTRDEMKTILMEIVGDNTDESVLNNVEKIMNGWNDDNTSRIAELENELAAEKERFKNRFWNGDGGQSQDGAKDYGNMDKEDIIVEFFKGV